MLQKADFITTISPWHVKQLSKYASHIELIYNGYDPEIFYPVQHVTSQFIITYTGRLISLATRDPLLLFEAIAQLNMERRIDPKQFRIQWYTDAESKHLLLSALKSYSINQFMDFFDYVPATDVPQILNRSSILLQLANKSTHNGPKGFMTTKLFEAMAVEKPLLCVRSDESFLEATINQTHSGLAARTVEEVYNFILQQYLFWKENGYTHIDTNKQAVESFSRKKQAEQFMAIFTKLNRK